jgi:carbon monoxide dehydrogenase subunit G
VPRIIALTAAALSAVLALPTAARAAAAPADPAGPAPATAAAMPPPPEDPADPRLTAALLGDKDVPAGFTPQLDAADDLFARIPAEIAACGKGARVPAGAVYREYVRGAGDEELLVETLAEPGADAARAAVAKIAGALPGCTSFTRAAGELPMDMTFTLSPYPKAPKIGDVSAAVSFVMTVPTMDLTVKGRVLAAAAGKAHVTVLLMTEADPKVADLEAAARTAVSRAAAARR